MEFDFVWEDLGLGVRPYPFTVGSFGETMQERERLRQETFAGLAARGLHSGDRGERVDARLEDLLTLLVRNDFSVDGQLSVGEYLRVLAAARGDNGVLAVQTDDEVRLRQVRGTAVVTEVIGMLPDEKPGPGESVTLPRKAFDDAIDAFASSGYLAFEAALNAGGLTGRDLRGMSTLVESGRHGGGQLAANRVDQLGRRTRTPVLNWFDTSAGRYLVRCREDRDRVEWLTLTPGDSARIGQRLTEMVASVRRE